MSDKKKLSKWQQLSLWDLACLFYWMMFCVSVCIIFNGPIDFRTPLHLTTGARVFSSLFLFWAGSIVLVQTLFGLWGTVKKLSSFSISPATALKTLTGFLWDSKTIFSKYTKLLPSRQIFFIGLIAVCILGLTETNPEILKLLKPAAWFMLLWSLFSCFSWTLNPLPFLEKTRSLEIVAKAKKTAVKALSEVKTSDVNNGQNKIIEHLENFKKVVALIPTALNFLRGPKLLFLLFTGIFVFGAVTSVLLISTILRIEHFLTDGGVFAGKFFNNTFNDYMYISLNHFLSSNMYNIDVIAPNVRFVLSFMPAASMTLALLLVLAFTMVGQNAVDTTFKNFGNDVLGIIDEATKNISEKREIVVIDQRKKETEPSKATNVNPATTKKVDSATTENVNNLG